MMNVIKEYTVDDNLLTVYLTGVEEPVVVDMKDIAEVNFVLPPLYNVVEIVYKSHYDDLFSIYGSIADNTLVDLYQCIRDYFDYAN